MLCSTEWQLNMDSKVIYLNHVYQHYFIYLIQKISKILLLSLDQMISISRVCYGIHLAQDTGYVIYGGLDLRHKTKWHNQGEWVPGGGGTLKYNVISRRDQENTVKWLFF